MTALQTALYASAFAIVAHFTAQAEDMVMVAPASVSAYCSCKTCCGSFPGKIVGQTASGKMAVAGRTLAAPKEFPFGTAIDFAEKGETQYSLLGIVEDRGSAIKIKDGVVHLDVYFASHKEALQWGRKEGIIRFKSVKKEDK